MGSDEMKPKETSSSPSLEVRRYPQETETHSHGHHQFVLPLSGTLEMEIAGKGGAVHGSAMAAVHAGEGHSFQGSGSNELLILDYPSGTEGGYMMSPVLAEEIAARPFVTLDSSLLALTRFLASENVRTGQGLAARGMDLFLEALTERLCGEALAEPAALRRAETIIRMRSGRDLEVRDLAREVGMSESRLHRLFRLHRGVTPGQAMTAARLSYAARLLAESRESLAEVALRAGFADQSSFTRAFRREMGATPADYRKTCQSRHKER